MTEPAEIPAIKTRLPIERIPAHAFDCEVCMHSYTYGWWGPTLAPARTHCHKCHRSWASLAEGHCNIDCHHFANVKAFDAHFGPDDEHLDPGTVVRRDGRPRFTTRTGPYGTTWRLAFYGKRPDFASRPTSGSSGEDMSGDEHCVDEAQDVDES